MGIQIGAKPDCGFDDPIGMLKDCHRRVERFLNILCVVAKNANARSLTGEEVYALQSALLYFRTGGKRHTADEEDSLFPRLRGELAAMEFQELERLEHDHNEADQLHADVDALFTAWIADGLLPEPHEQRLRQQAARLKQLYADHIQVEEQLVFPRAAAHLSRQTLAAIGEEFRNRRL